jgi:hypothetical protein
LIIKEVHGIGLIILDFETATFREKASKLDQKYEVEGSEAYGIRGDQSGGHES